MLLSLVIYLCIFTLSLFGMILFNRRLNILEVYCNINFINKIFYIILIFIPLLLLASFRYDTGTDYFSYIHMYAQIKNFSLLEYLNNKSYEYEYLYYVINRIIYILCDNVSILFFLTEFICILFVFLGVLKLQGTISITYSWFLFMVLFYLQSFNAIRQMIASALVFFSFSYVFKNKLWMFIAYIVIASLFHRIAIIFLIVYLFSYKKAKPFINLYYYSCILFSPLVLIFVFELAKYIPYISIYLEKYDVKFTLGGFGFLIEIVPPLIIYLIYYKKLIKYRQFNIYFNIFLLQIPFRYATYYSLWAGRLAEYASFSQLFLTPFIFSKINNKRDKKLIIIYFTVWYLVLFIYKFVILNTGHIFPYKSIFQK